LSSAIAFGPIGALINEDGQSLCNLDRAQRAKPERPSAIEFLQKLVRHACSGELGFMMFRALVSRRTLERRIEAVPAVIDWPDR
jgi:hypothetical protein